MLLLAKINCGVFHQEVKKKKWIDSLIFHCSMHFTLICPCCNGCHLFKIFNICDDS